MNTALFLGAGASVFASQPTTKQLLAKVKKHVESDNPDILQRFIMELVGKPAFKDVEELYDCIDQTINIQNTNGRVIVGDMVYQFHGHVINCADIVGKLTKLKLGIREILLDSFEIESGKFKMIKEVYDRIWSVMEKRGSDSFQIITTNYDMVIEQYCDETGMELVNGFMHNRSRLRGLWAGKWSPETNQPPIYLAKLHGSVNWYRDGNGKITETGDIARRSADDDIMIAPTVGPKEYTKAPFNALTKHFSEIINNIDMLVVIGFSFRDAEINEVIKRRVDEGMKLISISPTAVEDISRISTTDNLAAEAGRFQYKITTSGIALCEKEFGSDTIDDVCGALDAIYGYFESHKKRKTRS